MFPSPQARVHSYCNTAFSPFYFQASPTLVDGPAPSALLSADLQPPSSSPCSLQGCLSPRLSPIPFPQQFPIPALPWGSLPCSHRSRQELSGKLAANTAFKCHLTPLRVELGALLPPQCLPRLEAKSFHNQSTLPKDWLSPSSKLALESSKALQYIFLASS